MYKITGRRLLDGGRLKEFHVVFETKWRAGAKRMYLVGNFTSWFPGFKRMSRREDRAHASLFLYPGLYAYWFTADTDPQGFMDDDNPSVVELPNIMHPEKPGIKGSLLEVRPPENPFEYVIHDERDPAYLHRFKGYVVFRLRTGKGVDQAELVAGKAFQPVFTRELPFERVFEFILEDRALEDVFSYYFNVCSRGECLSYGFQGVGERAQPIVVSKKDVKGVEKPRWFMGTIYYQIFVDSFYNGDPSNDPPLKITRVSPREHGYYGGDLKGILLKLDHMAELGVEAIYLTPIYPSGTYHRYDVSDYLSVDKHLGTLDDFSMLVDALKNRGMRLVLDITLHHTGACHPFFIEALEKKSSSKYWSWFNFTGEPPSGVFDEALKLLRECDVKGLRSFIGGRGFSRPFYESFFNNWLMPKINHENPETLIYFKKVAETWMRRGVAGFRIDVAHGIMDEWLRAYYAEVKSLDEDFLLLGEVCDYPFLYGEYMDSYMNYWLRYWLVSTVVLRKHSLREAVEMINLQISSHPHHQVLSLYNMVGSHDTKRIKTLVKGDKTVLKLLTAIYFTLPGSPAIYYGDEIGLEGGDDPDNRRPMPWEVEKWDLEIYDTYRFFINLYKSVEELRHGFADVRICRGDVLVVERRLERRLIGLFNTGDRAVDPSECAGLAGFKEIASSAPGSKIPPLGFKIYLESKGA